MAMSTFRRNTKSEQKKGGKGLRGNWREQFRLPKGQPTPFVLISGEYPDPNPQQEMVEIDPATGQYVPPVVPYWKWLKHRLKGVNQNTGKQKFIDEPCSRGWDKHAPKPCAGCAAMESGDKRITLGEAYSMGLVHLVVYHRHPLVDPKKGPVMKKDNSGPVMVDSECLGKACNFCRLLSGQPPVLQQNEFWPNYDRNTIQNVFGSRRYLEIGSGHLGDIGEWDSQVGSRCGGIAFVKDAAGQYILDQNGNAIPKGRCNNFLTIDSYNCPKCGNVLIDTAADPRTPAQLEELATKKYPCHVCQQPVFMKEVNSCDAGCSGVQVHGIFDGVIQGVRQGEDTQSHLVLAGFVSVEEFESTLHPSVRALFQGKTLRQRIEELAKPYEFSELYKPKSLEEQAKRLEIQGYGGYGQAQQGWAPPGQPMMQQPGGYYGNQAPAPMQYPPQQQPMQYPPQQPQQPQYPPQQPQNPGYQQYGQPQQGPGPAPFVPPQQPNFGK